MRLALVYPPSMPPTSPPCGIAYLKAFINGGKAFDLNVRYFTAAVELLNKGQLPVEAEIQGYVLEPEHLKEAVHFFKGDFYDPEKYNKYCSIFFNYFAKIDSYVKEECMKYLFEGSASDEVLTLFDHLCEPLRKYHPDTVGFSQMVLSQREHLLGLATHLKSEDISLIVGGASLSQNPACYLSEVGNPKKDLSTIFDAVMYGEGELPLKAYLEEERREKIPNIVYKKDKIIKNKELGIEDIDTLPTPDFKDFPLQDYYTPEVVLPLLTSRGCYWMRCTFCIHYTSYYRYRTRSVKTIVNDLKTLKKLYNASHFLFADEMIHPAQFSKISDSILNEGLTITYYSEVKPTKEFTPELLKKMFQSGARALLWGVESGTQRVLDVIDKGTHISDIETVLKDSHKAGIWNMVFIIMGYPTQTEEEVKGDIAFLNRNSPYISSLAKSLFQLETGSRIYENPAQFGITKIEENPDPFSSVCHYTVSKGLTNKEAERIYREHAALLNLSKVSPYFGKLRDHLLLFADHIRTEKE